VRGEENPEQQAEIRGLAEGSRLPLKFVQGIQMLYELQTLMVPIVNCSDYPVPVLCPKQEAEPWMLPPQFAALARIPGKHRGGCTGIIARTRDGTVAHARNLDFSPVDVMTQLVFTGIFTRGGRELSARRWWRATPGSSPAPRCTAMTASRSSATPATQTTATATRRCSST